jgi:hypothetical protein
MRTTYEVGNYDMHVIMNTAEGAGVASCARGIACAWAGIAWTHADAEGKVGCLQAPNLGPDSCLAHPVLPVTRCRYPVKRHSVRQMMGPLHDGLRGKTLKSKIVYSLVWSFVRLLTVESTLYLGPPRPAYLVDVILDGFSRPVHRRRSRVGSLA